MCLLHVCVYVVGIDSPRAESSLNHIVIAGAIRRAPLIPEACVLASFNCLFTKRGRAIARAGGNAIKSAYLYVRAGRGVCKKSRVG